MSFGYRMPTRLLRASFLAGATINPLGPAHAFVVPVCAGLLGLVAVLAGSGPIRAACLAATGGPA